MNNNDYMEVYFNQYCKTCKHEKLTEMDEPCCFCLCESVNFGTHKPVNWKPKDKTK